MWRAIRVRANAKSEAKFETLTKYCIYDEQHNDYLNTSEWVDFIIKLVLKHGFNKENIHH